MALTVITGAANSGKTGHLYQPVVEAARCGSEAVLLLPSHVDVLRARLEFSNRAPVGIHVATFESYAEHLWQLARDGRRFVTSPIRHLALLEAMKRAEEALLADSSKYTGMLRLLNDVVIRTAGLPVSVDNDATAAAVASVCSSYRDVLEGWGWVEPGEALTVLATTHMTSSRPVSVNRFTDVTPQQEAFLLGLAQTCDVRIALTYVAGDRATTALLPLVQRLSSAGARFVEATGSSASNELASLAEAVSTGARVRSRGHVSLIEAPGPEAEIAAVADAVATAIERGVPAERIAVVFRDVKERHQAIEAALAGRGVAADVDISVSWGRTALGQAAQTLLGLAAGSGSREDLIGLLRTPYTDVPSVQVDDLDRTWRRYRITEVRSMLDGCAPRGRLFSRAHGAARSLVGSGCRPDLWVALADALLQSASLNPRGDTDSRLDAAAHKAVISYAEALADTPSAPDYKMVIQGLSAMHASTAAHERPGAVVVTEAHRIRGRRFDVVVLGGLSGSEFSSGDRERLSTSIIRRLGAPVGAEPRLAERMLFHSIITRPRDALVLVRQAVDARGEATRPSVFWDTVLDAYAPEDRTALFADRGAKQREPLVPVFDPERAILRRRVACGEMDLPRTMRGRLDDAATPVADTKEFSVTEIETYLRCPYAWFYDRVLRPRTLDRAFDARERGSVAHALLARVYRSLRDDGFGRVDEGCLNHALAVLDREAAALLDQHILVGLEEELAWEQATRWCAGVLQADETFLLGFEPIAEEWRFGSDVERPFVFAGIEVRGAVDRVDCGPSGLVVTDYKSSSTVAGMRRFADEPHLQPVVYALAAAHWFHAQPIAGLYRSFSSGNVAGYWNTDRAEPDGLLSRKDHVDEPGFGELVEYAAAQCEHAVDGMRNGRIAPAPVKGACEFCGAKAVCGGRR